MTRLVVVGGNGAGMSAASKAKRRAPGLEVEVLEAGPDISYSSCGIPYLVQGLVSDPEQLRVLSPADAASRGIAIRTQCTVSGFNPYTKEITFEGPGGRDALHYDKLLIATGTTPRNPFVGGHLDGVFALRQLADGVRLHERLAKSRGKRVAIVGGGYLGLEMAAAFRGRGSQVHLFQRGSRLLSSMDADMTDGLVPWLEKAGVHVHLNAGVEGFTEGKVAGRLGRVEAKEPVAVDAAIVAVGLQPATGFAVKAGVTSTKEGHLLVDDQMRTNFHDVWAAGDCVAPRHVLTGRPAALALALPSNRMGRVAGDNIAASTEDIPGPSLFFPGVIGTAITRLFGLAFAQTGLTQQMCEAEGIDCVSALIESKSQAGYMPEVGDMAVKVVAEAGTGKLLGVQIAGPEDAGLRINAAAVALHAGLKVEKLADVETAYAPPFSPVWDPLIVAAEQCAKEVKK